LSAYVKFRIKDIDKTFLLAWTTTPWTLPSNVALAVNATELYVTVQTENNERYILAKERLHILDERYEIIDECCGQELLNLEYEPLFNYVVPDKKAFYVVAGDFVTLQEGTGIVHIAPAFGDDDYQLSRKYICQLFN